MRTTSARRRVAALAFGVVVTLVILEVGLRLAGLAYRVHQRRAVGLAAPDEGAVRILCIGESTTADGGRDSYPSQLEALLNERAAGRRFRVYNEGLAGTDTATLAYRLDGNLARSRPHAVVTMMGINDGPETPVFRPEAPPAGDPRRRLASLRVVKLAALLRSRLAPVLALRRPASAPESWAGLALQAVGREAVTGSLPAGVSTPESHVQALVREAYEAVSRGRHDEAEKRLRHAVLLGGDHDVEPRFRLGEFLCGIERFDDGIAVLEEAYRLDDRHEDLVGMLAACYDARRDFARAEPLYRRAIELDPTNVWRRLDLAMSYAEQQRFDACGAELEHALAVDASVGEVYLRLADCYWRDRKREASAATLERLIEREPENERAIAKLALCFDDLGDNEKARAHRTRANELRLANLNPATVANYRWVASRLSGAGILHVAVAYPARPLAPLEAILGEQPEVVLVDNQESFQAAVERDGFGAIFADRFAGDFGHATPRGNHLLAENVARAVLSRLPDLPG